VDLETYTFVPLRRGPRAFEYTEDELVVMTWLTRKGALA
jgi:hypothetical protein